MRFTPLGMVFLLIGFFITPCALAAMIAVERSVGINSPYRAAFALIGGLGSITFVWSLIMTLLRYDEFTKRLSDWLQNNNKIYWLVIVPAPIICMALLSRWLGW